MILLAGASAAFGQYGGPASLSPGARVGNRSGNVVSMRFFANVNGVYDTGIVPVITDESGDVADVGALYGVEAQVGLYGTKSWRRSSLGVDYLGGYRNYNNNKFFNGSDHSLSVGYTNQLTSRWLMDLRQIGGTSSLGTGNFYGANPLPPGLIGSTGLQFFDNRVYFAQSVGTLTRQQTSKLSWTVGGVGYWVRRQSDALVGVNGYALQGGVNYQLNRRTGVGVNFSFSHFDFQKAFGETDSNLLQISIVQQLSRRWSITLSGGAFRVSTAGLQSVTLDPIIAEILGQTQVTQAYSQTAILPNYNVSLNGSWRTWGVNANYSRGVFPGNGILLTTYTDNVGANYSYTGVRKWNFGASGGFNYARSFGPTLDPFITYFAGAGATYNLAREWHLTARYDYRWLESGAGAFGRNGARIMAGVAWSPGEVPLSLW